MPKPPIALASLPPVVLRSLQLFGENLAVARIRRHETQSEWARRMGVSRPTLIRMEQGDAGVGVGIYATALWLMGRAEALPDLAAPAEDRGALEADVREAMKRRPVRSAGSAEARLRRKKSGE
jgi:transcriptional regulator with XRE-family HTH domain